MPRLTVLALVAMLVLAACGGGDGAEGEIRSTVEGFIHDLRSNPPEAYTYLAQDCKDQLDFGSFASSLFLLDQILGESELELRDFRIIRTDASDAAADFDIVIAVEGEDIPLPQGITSTGAAQFVKEDGRWRFADCENFIPAQPQQGASAATVTPPDTQSPLEAAIAAEADADPALPGEYVDLAAIYGGQYGNDGPSTAPHVTREVDYAGDGNSNPPAGGPHWSGACTDDPSTSPPFCGPAPWGIYRDPWEAETLVHNMEHGGVVVWYNTTNEGVIGEIEALVANRLPLVDLLVMAPYPEMEDETIALTAWSRIDKFPVSDYTPERVQTFIETHVRRFNPESF